MDYYSKDKWNCYTKSSTLQEEVSSTVGVLECETDRIDAMALIGVCFESFAFEYMAEMTPTGGARNFRTLHAPRVVFTAGHCTRNSVIKRRPPTTALEFSSSSVERSAASCARIDAFGGIVFVVFSLESSLCAFLAEDFELVWREYCAPLVIAPALR